MANDETEQAREFLEKQYGDLEALRQKLVARKAREDADKAASIYHMSADQRMEQMVSEATEKAKALVRAPEDFEKFYDELDAQAEEIERLEVAWIDALSSWKISREYFDIEDTEGGGPFVEAFFEGEWPEEWTRKKARTELRIWQRKRENAQLENRAKRKAGLKRHGVDIEDIDLIGEIDAEQALAETEEILSQRKADSPYIEGAKLLVETWRRKGASLQGVPKDLSKINHNSKVVRWFKDLTEGKSRRHVSETAKRMSAKKSWAKDVEKFKAFK